MKSERVTKFHNTVKSVHGAVVKRRINATDSIPMVRAGLNFLSITIDNRRPVFVVPASFLKTNCMIKDIIELVRNMVGDNYLYLSEPVQYKYSPHITPYHIQAVCVSPDDRLFISDDPTDSDSWLTLNPDYLQDRNLISTLYQRLLSINYKKTA